MRACFDSRRPETREQHEGTAPLRGYGRKSFLPAARSRPAPALRVFRNLPDIPARSAQVRNAASSGKRHQHQLVAIPAAFQHGGVFVGRKQAFL